MKKCLLIAPYDIAQYFPRGMMEIAGFLDKRGCPVEVLPLAYYFHPIFNEGSKESGLEKRITEFLKKAIARTDPAVIGVTNQWTMHHNSCLKILETCKKIKSDVVTVIGGSHPTFCDTDTVKSPFVDIVVRREGEWTMLDLVSAISKKKDLESVKGITFKRGGTAVRTPDRPLGDLTELPPLNFELLPHDYVRKAEIYGFLNRGCYYNCKFCSERRFWKKRRQYTVGRLIDEMKVLKSEYKTQIAALGDSQLYFSSDQFCSFSAEVRREKIALPQDFYVISNISAFGDEAVRLLAKTGIHTAWIGIESASPNVLKAMNKSLTVKQIVETCEKLRDRDIKVCSFLIIGHPGDNPREAAYSLDIFTRLFNEELTQVAEASYFLPYPGTEFFSTPQKYGIEILSYDWSRWVTWRNEPVCQLKDFSAKDIASFHERMLRFTLERGLLDGYIKKMKDKNRKAEVAVL